MALSLLRRKRTEPCPQPNYRAIRRMELELGLREWEDVDTSDFKQNLLSQVRYFSTDDFAQMLSDEQERVRRMAAI